MKGIQHKLSGQIMVIVLLIISVLSIIALTATLNTSRDTQEQQQNKQYQQYYAVGERKIMDMVQVLGKRPIANAPVPTITLSDINFECTEGCDLNATSRTYSNEDPIPPENYNTSGATAEFLDSSITVTDVLKIESPIEVSIEKDQDILLNLSASTGNIIFNWKGASGIPGDQTVAWNISYDYKLGDNYLTDKYVWNIKNIGPYGSLDTPGADQRSDQECFQVSSYNASANGITITLRGTCNGQLYLRLKPVTNSGPIIITYLEVLGNSTPLARTITGATSTSDTGGTGSATKASVVLETTYLLTQSPLSLFDYVLRSEGSVIKD